MMQTIQQLIQQRERKSYYCRQQEPIIVLLDGQEEIGKLFNQV